jgi:hypothetical protein
MKKREKITANSKIGAAVAQTAAASVIDESPKGQELKATPSPPDVAVTHLEFPPPEFLLEAARNELNRKLLQDYRETINVLRDNKGFSFREIAEWLTENGVDADYNAVYREYTKGMSDDEERDVALREAEEENERP